MEQYYQVNFINQAKMGAAKSGTKLTEVIQSEGVPFSFLCNGNGSCGKCKLKIKGSVNAPTAVEKTHLQADELNATIRLACQIVIFGDVIVEIPQQDQGVVLTAGQPDQVELDPLWQQFTLKTPISWEEIQQAIGTPCKPELRILRELAEYPPDHRIRLDIIKDQIISWGSSNQVQERFGIAIDIGTTTLAVYLVNLSNGNVVATASEYNHQVAFGADLISRIEYASSVIAIERLQQTLTQQIDRLIKQVTDLNQVASEQVIQVHCVGNTCMLHLLLGINPIGLGKAPYKPVFISLLTVTPKQLAISAMNPNGYIYILPGIGGQVGSDISVGVLLCQLRPTKNELFIDIGTNGELVLAGNGHLFACSTAAGPAFEGAQLSCGMFALPGAITDLSLNGSDLTLTTIGNQSPLGICGSGFVRIMSELLRGGIISSSGSFSENVDPNLSYPLKQYYLTKDKTIYVTQKDIRNFQLAKAAIRTGIELLLRKNGLAVGDVKTIYIGGAFGNFLRAADLIHLGLIPKIALDKIKFIGNSAGMGAVQTLISQRRFEELIGLSKEVCSVNLAEEPSFMEVFTDSLYLGD